ncbi:MAG: CCA tRNA nucleotidyltransferase [Candidatus Latescibacterota bacterium]
MIDPGALHIARRLGAAGHRALLAGGCVRDWLQGWQPKDWDIATDADREQVMALFPRTLQVGVRFGIVVVVLEEGTYEVARFRREADYADGRHPRTVQFADPETDARRRDFTINGMFLDPVAQRVLDFVGGRRDLERGIVRAIGAPRQRFGEDYLRMLRAVRFAARFGFALAPETYAAIGALAPLIRRTSTERVRDEVTRILTEGRPGRGLRLLLETGLLQEVLPEVAAMAGVPQPPVYHPEGDVFTHVCLCLDRLRQPGPVLAWATLLHDVGKPSTYTESDRIRFHEHDAVGAAMAERLARGLRLPADQVRRLCELVAQHMRMRHVRQMRPGRLKRFLRQPHFAELLELHRADCLASHGDLDLYEFCRHTLGQLRQEDLRPAPLLCGHDLQRLGLEPGPAFGRILDSLEEEQLEGRVRTRQEAEAFVRQHYLPPG